MTFLRASLPKEIRPTPENMNRLLPETGPMLRNPETGNVEVHPKGQALNGEGR